MTNTDILMSANLISTSEKYNNVLIENLPRLSVKAINLLSEAATQTLIASVCVDSCNEYLSEEVNDIALERHISKKRMQANKVIIDRFIDEFSHYCKVNFIPHKTPTELLKHNLNDNQRLYVEAYLERWKRHVEKKTFNS